MPKQELGDKDVPRGMNIVQVANVGEAIQAVL